MPPAWLPVKAFGTPHLPPWFSEKPLPFILVPIQSFLQSQPPAPRGTRQPLHRARDPDSTVGRPGPAHVSGVSQGQDICGFGHAHVWALMLAVGWDFTSVHRAPRDTAFPCVLPCGLI